MSGSTKVKLKGKYLIVIFVISSLVLISFILYLYFKPVTTYNYHGKLLHFRADLREARNVPVYPDDSTVFNLTMNPSLKNVSIVFVPSEDNGMVGVEGFEVSSKLAIAYLTKGYHIPIKGSAVDSYNLSGTEENLIIALVPPVLANETSVRVGNNAVFISGKSYKDFDLATVRFLTIILEIYK